MARHRSPQGRHAHLEPPLSANLAAAGVGGGHRSIPVPQLTSSLPARFVATVVAGGALAAAGQHALAQTLPVAADGAALRVAVEELLGGGKTAEETASDAAAYGNAAFGAVDNTVLADTGVAVSAFAPVVPETVSDLPQELVTADAEALVKAADLQKAAVEAAAAAAAQEAARVAEEARKVAEAAAAEEAAAKAAKAAEAAASDAAGSAEKATAGSAVQLVSGRITSGFGSRWGRSHQGLDIAAPIGTPIRAPLAGTVLETGPASGFGLWVRVQHADGTVTVYGHINRSLVRKGQEVAAGEVIAEVGNRGRSTGPHLHMEVVTPNGNKINPRPWLDDHGITV